MIEITLSNVETILDSGKLFVAMRNGNFWQLRRNGATKRWKKDATRIRIPVKAGLRVTSWISETDFIDGILRADYWRHVDDVPAKPKR